MKSPLYLVAIFAYLFISSEIFGQSCGNTSDWKCDYSGLNGELGFTSSGLLPCLVLGQYVEVGIPFNCYNKLGADSVFQFKIESLTNLPCGMCWMTTMGDNIFQRGEGGCLIIQGTPTGNLGQYVFAITVSLDTDGDGSFDKTGVVLNSVLASNKKILLRLVGVNDDCEGVNFNASGVSCQ